METYFRSFVLLCCAVFHLVHKIDSLHFNGATISWKSSKTKAKTATFFWKAGWIIGRGPCGATCDDTKLNTYGVRSLGSWKCYSGCSTEATLAPQDYWITSYNIDEDFEQGENTFTHTFNSDNNIEVGFKGFDWRPLSSVTAGAWSIITTVDLRARSDTGHPNSSPTTASKPVFRYQFSCDSKLRIPLVDPDGDVVKCRWATGGECASACNALPGATLDQETCTIDFKAGTGDGFIEDGWYVASLMIIDYPRETITVGGVTKTTANELSTVPLQFLITTPKYLVSCDSKPNFTSPTPADGEKFRVAPNGNLILKIYATNPVDPSVRVGTYSVSAPTGLLRTSVRDDDLGRSDITYIALYWTPTADQKGENIICVMAQDDNGKTGDYRCFYVLAWDYDECLSGPCINDGTCVNLEDKFLCLCPTGYFSGIHCEIDIHDSCVGHGCQNNATCVDGAYNNTCTCVAGYNGANCEIDIDECASNPCQNNGTCNNLLNKYTCDCVPGFNGNNCEHNIDECFSSPCWKGTCNDVINGYTCTCKAGWQGTNCFQDINECLSNPCQNNATCLNKEAYYLCQCQPGYAGVHCEIDIDECASFPCQSNGTCSDFSNKFECQCIAGLTGAQCQTNIDECASSPCQHGSTCVDLLDGYQCNCSKTWYGTHCEYNDNPCHSFPCLYGATCVNQSPNYQCICAQGWMGDNCEHDFDECISNPCPANATCINKVNLYECVCVPGWTGPDCDLPAGVLVPNQPPTLQNQSGQSPGAQTSGLDDCSCTMATSNSFFSGCTMKTNCSCMKGMAKETVHEKTEYCGGELWPKVMLPLLSSLVGAAALGIVWAVHARKMSSNIHPLTTCSHCGHVEHQRYIKSASTLKSTMFSTSIASSLDKNLLRNLYDGQASPGSVEPTLESTEETTTEPETNEHVDEKPERMDSEYSLNAFISSL